MEASLKGITIIHNLANKLRFLTLQSSWGVGGNGCLRNPHQSVVGVQVVDICQHALAVHSISSINHKLQHQEVAANGKSAIKIICFRIKEINSHSNSPYSGHLSHGLG